MRAIIVDDEYYAMQGLKMELEDIGDIEIAGLYEDGKKMLEEITEVQPDVIFLDIEMPQINGFEILEKLADLDHTPNIVFVTAYSHYAVKAFEVNAADYIVKPITKTRLLRTIDRITPIGLHEKKHEISVSCFGHFSILVDGNEINAGWRTRKAEELIAYLLSEKGRFVSKEKIAEALWPEQDAEKSVSNLYLAYYYIKKQENKLGVKIPVESHRGKMRINVDHILCDMLEFDKLLDTGNKAGAGKKAAYLEKAAELYQGLLFEDRYYTWVDTIQGNYEYRYVQLLNSLIEYHRKNGELKKAGYYEEKLNKI
jgi:two-component SAPR family response regulator